jgi:hypothetical protein
VSELQRRAQEILDSGSRHQIAGQSWLCYDPEWLRERLEALLAVAEKADA